MHIPKLFIKLCSYLYPITYKTYNSDISGKLELTWYDGKLLLNTENTNYSYGNLQMILDRSINKIDRSKFKKFENILVLGVAGGSVIETLYDKYKYQNTVDGVEIDPVIVKIARQEFNIDRFKNCNLFVADAFEYVKKCTKKYNLIIIDLFIDYKVPEFVFDKTFLHSVEVLLNNHGVILLNTIELDKKQKVKHQILMEYFKNKYYINILNNLDEHNIVYLIEKK